MIVDSSVLVAILRGEPEAARFADVLAASADNWISAGNYVEAAAVVEAGRDPVARRRFDELLEVARVRVADLTVRQSELACAAYRDFGKGSGHPARLNLGDCFAYALAKDRGEPLLFKGEDFTHTDLHAVT